MDVTKISLDGQLTLLTYIGKDCYYRNGSRNVDESNGAWLTLPYNFRVSNTQNKLFAIGCDTFALIQSTGDAETGCSSICGSQSFHDILYDGTCSGLGCCQTTIPKNILSYRVSVQSFYNHTNIWQHNHCSYVFVAENNSFNFSEGDLMNLNNRTMVPTILDWAIGNSTCENYPSDFACPNKYSHCVNSTNGPGYRCMCLDGYKGNPYVPDGCKDIDECAETPNPCGRNTCENTPGNYTCTCKEGYEGEAERDGGGCEKTLKAKAPVIAITVGIVVGIAAFLIVGSWIYWGFNKRKHLLRRQRFFEQNGGLMLKCLTLELDRCRLACSKTICNFPIASGKSGRVHRDRLRICITK